MNSLAREAVAPIRRGEKSSQLRAEAGMLLLNGLASAVFLVARDGVILYHNQAAESLIHAVPENGVGHPLSQVLLSTSEGASQLEHALASAANGDEVQLDLSLSGNDGGAPERIFHFAVRPGSMRGDSTRILVEARDITDESMRERESAHRLSLAQSERDGLRSLLSHTPAGIGLTSGPEHRWTFINDDFVRLTGRLSASDFLGKSAREVMPEMYSQGFFELLDEVYRTGQPYYGREVRARVNRSARGLPEEGFFDFMYQPMCDADGKVQGIFLYAIEVTNVVAARRAVEDNVDRLRLAQSAAQIGVWEWDPIRETTQLSPELHRIFGTDAENGDHSSLWASRVHRSDWGHVQMLMNEGHRLGFMEFEYRYHHPHHGQRWLYCKGNRRPAETRMFGIVQDITARKNAEMAAEHLAAIVESSDDAIVSKDLNGVVTSWNPGAQRIFGYTAAEMIGQPITKIIPNELYEDETRILSTIARGERIEHFETVRVHKSGELIEVSLTVSPIKDHSGRIIGAAKIARDITQQKKAERALRTSERLASVGRLAATVAHEINNPLEAVTNLVFLASNADDPKPYLQMAEEELERVSQLTRQTLGFYRETKAAARVCVGELVESLVAVFTPRMRNKNVTLTSEIKKVEITAVPGEIRQVVANLLSNSIDALAPGGRIRIRVSPVELHGDQRIAGARITVADNGSGIPASVRERLFEPFFTTKKEVGTGLGLWICKSIVENHHGKIRVRSRTAPECSGTVFSIFLPA